MSNFYKRLTEKATAMGHEVKQTIGIEVPTPDRFAVEIQASSQKITELLEHLRKNFPQEEFTKLAEINPSWANAGNNPLGGLAEMGHQKADEIINPKRYILEEIQKIKNKIEKFSKKMEDQPHAKKIVSAWETFVFDHNLGDLSLNQLPEALKSFAKKLNRTE